MAIEKTRCRWAESSELMREYHDQEWGVPLREARDLWELLMLEGFQAGLSWSVVLNKREAFQAAFHQFDPQKVARMTERDVAHLLEDPRIIRSRAKIEATIHAATLFVEMQRNGEDFAGWLWSFVQNEPQQAIAGRTVSPESEAMSKALKKRGFKFVGPTIVYAFMQAAGMVNDHVESCFRRSACARLAKRKAR